MQPAWLEKEIIRMVESRYTIGVVNRVWEITGGYNNRSFGVHTTAEGRDATYFVRLYRSGVGVDEIRFEHELIRHVIGGGFTMVADILVNRSGNTLTRSADGKRLFAVYEYLKGEDRYTWTRTDLSNAEAGNAAVILAEFHCAARTFDPGRLRREEPPIHVLLAGYRDRFLALARQADDDPFGTVYRANLDALLDALARHVLTPDEIAGLPVIPAHYDFHPGNLKWHGETVVGLFDFDWSKMDLRLFDVCMAVVYCCSWWGGERDGELRRNKFSRFLSSYQQRLLLQKGLDPLSEKEKRLLPRMLTIANLYLVHWEVSDYYGPSGPKDGLYEVYLKHSLRLMRWLGTHGAVIAETVSSLPA